MTKVRKWKALATAVLAMGAIIVELCWKTTPMTTVQALPTDVCRAEQEGSEMAKTVKMKKDTCIVDAAASAVTGYKKAGWEIVKTTAAKN